MVDDPCLSQLRDYGRDMVVEPMYSLSILSSIALYLLDIVRLFTKEICL
jgi:hypothetical protein